MGKGLLSDMAKLTLAYNHVTPDLPKTVIAKLPPPQGYIRDQVLRLKLFEKEIRFYTEVAPKSPIRTPDLIYSAMDSEHQRHVLLLQDCSHYAEIDPQLDGLSYQQTKIIVLKIADFHARWWDDKSLSSFYWMPRFDDPEAKATNIDRFRFHWDACIQMEDFKNALPEGGLKAGQKIYEQRPWLFETAPGDKLTVYHGDFKSDNMFFDRDTPQDPLVFFDWSTVKIGRGTADLSYLLGYCLATELRRQYEKDVLRSYYDRLLDRGVTNYSFDECYSDYLRGLVYYIYYPVVQMRFFSDARGQRVSTTGLQRMFSAVLDNEATRILP